MLTKYQQNEAKAEMDDAKGIGVIFWLTIAFVIAKLAGLIAWSWFWVFSPLLITTAVCIAGLIVIFLIAILSTIIE
jgi:fatty acid desaturase